MVKNIKLSPSDYYSLYPSLKIETGDIWTNIPTLGLLNGDLSSAIIINPTCDLAQKKTRVITLLPIITIHDYIYSSEFFYELRKDFTKIFEENDISCDRYRLPCKKEILKIVNSTTITKSNANIIKKLSEYYKYIDYLDGDKLDENNRPDISKIINIGTIVEKIVKNSYSSDIHYLPPDNQDPTCSAIKDHSVALFKYAVSYPIVIFSTAMNTIEELWSDETSLLDKNNKTACLFKKYPVNSLKLKDDFLSDFMSRYLNMHLRFGSRDFSDDDIKVYSKQIIRGL